MAAWQGILLFLALLALFLLVLRQAALRHYRRHMEAGSAPGAGASGTHTGTGHAPGRQRAEEAGGEGLDETAEEELVAVLAAAAAMVTGGRVRLRTIRFLRGGGDSAWAVTGRLNIMASHLVRKGNL